MTDARDLEKRAHGASTDWRSMFDRDYIGAWDLMGRDVVVTIAKVEASTLTAPGGKKNKKPVVHFEGREKGLALNRTNAKTIAAIYGNDTSKWVGQRITIYPTQTQFGGDTVECIRVRPTPPQRGGKPNNVSKAAVHDADGVIVETTPEQEPPS